MLGGGGRERERGREEERKVTEGNISGNTSGITVTAAPAAPVAETQTTAEAVYTAEKNESPIKEKKGKNKGSKRLAGLQKGHRRKAREKRGARGL